MDRSWLFAGVLLKPGGLSSVTSSCRAGIQPPLCLPTQTWAIAGLAERSQGSVGLLMPRGCDV